jgi:hypothetical protein
MAVLEILSAKGSFKMVEYGGDKIDGAPDVFLRFPSNLLLYLIDFDMRYHFRKL